MTWVDESRRRAFEQTLAARTDHPQSLKVGDLESLLATDFKQRAVAVGNELILPYEDSLAAIGTATQHLIAVLGFEAGEIQEDGFQVLDYSGYDNDVPFTGDWNAYVTETNVHAERWIKAHYFGRNHGYVLTSTSEREFRELGDRIK